MNESDPYDIWKDILTISESKTAVINSASSELSGESYCGRPLVGKIIVLPISSAQNFAPGKLWYSISITDPGMQHPPLGDIFCEGVLRVAFDDIEFQRAGKSLITNDQAKEIWQSVDSVWDKIEVLMIHCHAGASRSPAVAKAISMKYQPEFASFFDDLYSPNELVYNIMMKTI
jgi:hypothetical protein